MPRSPASARSAGMSACRRSRRAPTRSIPADPRCATTATAGAGPPRSLGSRPRRPSQPGSGWHGRFRAATGSSARSGSTADGANRLPDDLARTRHAVPVVDASIARTRARGAACSARHPPGGDHECDRVRPGFGQRDRRLAARGPRDGRTTDLSRIGGVEAGTALKAYARAASLDGPAIAIQPDGAGLAIEWDRQAAPFLGVWIDAGGWPAGTGRHQVALEPTTAPHDDLASAVAAGSAAWARVDRDVTWWTTLRLVGANAGTIRP